MNKEELMYYNKIGNWDFSQIKYEVESYTNWDYIKEIQKNIKYNSKVLDLGTADGSQIFKHYPKCSEILGTDFSKEMIKNANAKCIKSKRKEILFRIMDNLKIDTPKEYFDIVTARHTITDKYGIYDTLKENGKLIIRGVDKLDCWSLKMLFNQGQGYDDKISISQKDYEDTIKAGFKDVVLIPIHIIEYYKTKEDLLALLLKVPILTNKSWNNDKIDMNLLNKYIESNTTDKGIRLIRRYYGIIATK